MSLPPCDTSVINLLVHYDLSADCPQMSSPPPLSVIPNIPHLHRLRCHPPASLFQSSSHYLPSSCVLCRCLSTCSCVSAVSPLPPFISFPNIYRCRTHLTTIYYSTTIVPRVSSTAIVSLLSPSRVFYHHHPSSFPAIVLSL